MRTLYREVFMRISSGEVPSPVPSPKWRSVFGQVASCRMSESVEEFTYLIRLSRERMLLKGSAR